MAHRALSVSVALALALAATTARAQTPPPDEASATADGERIRSLLDAVVEGPMAERERALAELEDVAPSAIPAIEAFLTRQRRASDGERRAVLGRISAAVPDEDGRFRSPGRESAQQIRDDDDFDWLAHLSELPEMPGLGGVMADAAAVRALAATQDPDAARAILEFAFSEDGLVIRDECGRHLRNMAPQSLPALIRGAGDRDNPPAMRRYARYQLSRLDREDPPKALSAAGGEDLQVEILRAYADTLWREAVHSVLELINYESPAVRSAAREAWIEYVAGPPPPPATERYLNLPGGRRSDEPEQLYKNARELADYALRRRYAEVFEERPPRGAALEELSHALFDHHDDERRAQLDAAFEDALATADAGELDEAIAEFDRILVQDPDFDRRDEMVDIYMVQGETQREAGAYREATAAFAKAYMLAPEGARAEEAREAQRHARALEIAEATDDDEAVRELEPPSHGGEELDRPWLLFGGIGVGLVAVFLGVIGIAVRRRQAQRI